MTIKAVISGFSEIWEEGLVQGPSQKPKTAVPEVSPYDGNHPRELPAFERLCVRI